MEFTKDIQFNTNPTVNEDLTITYNGFLGHSQELSIVYGYGEAWENTSEIKMEKTEKGFVGTINLLNYDTLNFCFKNSNNEWDNNSYCNYITGITPAIEQAQTFDIDALIEELLFEPIVNIETNSDVELISETQEENVDLAYQLSNLMENAEYANGINNVELTEYSTLDEILTASHIENSLDTEEDSNIILEEIEEFEPQPTYFFNNNITNNIQNFNSVYDEFINNLSTDYQEFDNSANINNVNNLTLGNISQENNAIFEDFINNLSSITLNRENEKNNLNIQNITEEQNSNPNEETSLVETEDSFIVSSRQASKFYLFKKRIKLALYKAFVKLPKILLGIEDEER